MPMLSQNMGIQPEVTKPEGLDFYDEMHRGNFLPFLALLHQQHPSVSPNMIIDLNTRRQVVHLVAHFGQVLTMRALAEHFYVELFETDANG